MRYLSVMSRFHRYSVNNTMLIYMQNPGLIDLFTRQARKNMQEQQKSSVLQKLRQEPPARKPAAPKKQEPER